MATTKKKPAKSTKPATSTKPAKPAKPAKSAKPAKAATSAKPVAAKPTTSSSSSSFALSFAQLVALLGKRVDDPAVIAMIDALGAKKDSDYIIATKHGVEIALGHQAGEKRKVLSAMFLHGPREKPTRPPYDGLPAPFVFSDRAAMRVIKTPDEAWNLDEGDLPITSENSRRDTWHMPGYDIAANYDKDGRISNYYVEATGASKVGEPMYVDPLHFETKPADGPDDAALVGPALLLAWATTRVGPSPKHANTDAARDLAKRAITPVTFFQTACKGELSTLDFHPDLDAFLNGYLHQLFTDTRAPNRDATADAITKLWGLEKSDTRYWGYDYRAAFLPALSSLYYVPDRWEAFDRLAALLDARWDDFRATGFKAPPDLARYEQAARARDAIALVAARKELAPQKRDDTLTKDLLALIGKPLKDPAIKPVFARAGLPIGKRIDEQANPELGIVYLGTNTKIDGKTVLIVEYVRFHSTGESRGVRGLGKTVTFVGYPNALPGGIFIGSSRADVTKAYGTPAKTTDDSDIWYVAKNKMIAASYANGTLLNIKYGPPPSWGAPPEPPYSPADIF